MSPSQELSRAPGAFKCQLCLFLFCQSVGFQGSLQLSADIRVSCRKRSGPHRGEQETEQRKTALFLSIPERTQPSKAMASIPV